MEYYNASTTIYYDGEFLSASEAQTDLYSQSLHYGYAVFEGIRSYQTEGGETRIFKGVEHYERLKQSSALVYIPYNYDTEELMAVSYQLLEKNNLQNAYIRPLLFCSPNMSLTKAKQSHLMICTWEWPALLGQNLLKVMTSSFERPNPNAFLMNAKVSGHYINSILAAQEARDKGFDEALLLDISGNVAEGPGANVFFEIDGKLFTPPLGNILPGITRATVIEICEELNIEVEQAYLKPNDIKGVDAAFFCGTAAEVIGWESLDGIHFTKPWKYTQSKLIQDAYRARVLEQQTKLSEAIAS